jgi:hypothetical protein
MADDKTFAVGEVLSAADTNEYLMRGYWKRIGRQIVSSGSPVSAVTFSSIESRFRSFRLHISASRETVIRLNNDSGANYSFRVYDVDDAAVIAGSGDNGMYFNSGFGGPIMQDLTITKLATTSRALIAGVGTGIQTSPNVGYRHGTYAWINTSALINRIDVIGYTGTMYGVVALEGMVGV